MKPESQFAQEIETLAIEYDTARKLLLEHPYHTNRNGYVPADYMEIVDNYYQKLARVQEFGLELKPEMQKLQSEEIVDDLEEYLKSLTPEKMLEYGKEMLPGEFYLINSKNNYCSFTLGIEKEKSLYPSLHLESIPTETFSARDFALRIFNGLGEEGYQKTRNLSYSKVIEYENVEFAGFVEGNENNITLEWHTKGCNPVIGYMAIEEKGILNFNINTGNSRIEFSLGMLKKVHSMYYINIATMIDKDRKRRLIEYYRMKKQRKKRRRRNEW